MSTNRNTLRGIVIGLSLITWLIPLKTSPAEEPAPAGFRPRGAYIEISESFYRTLKNEEDEKTRVYGRKQSDEYLRRIAVSTRFMVETNLKILEQQDKIIELLESMTREERSH